MENGSETVDWSLKQFNSDKLVSKLTKNNPVGTNPELAPEMIRNAGRRTSKSDVSKIDSEYQILMILRSEKQVFFVFKQLEE